MIVFENDGDFTVEDSHGSIRGLVVETHDCHDGETFRASHTLWPKDVARLHEALGEWLRAEGHA